MWGPGREGIWGLLLSHFCWPSVGDNWQKTLVVRIGPWQPEAPQVWEWNVGLWSLMNGDPRSQPHRNTRHLGSWMSWVRFSQINSTQTTQLAHIWRISFNRQKEGVWDAKQRNHHLHHLTLKQTPAAHIRRSHFQNYLLPPFCSSLSSWSLSANSMPNLSGRLCAPPVLLHLLGVKNWCRCGEV